MSFDKLQQKYNEIGSFEFDKEEVFDMIKSGEINDAKTICGLMRSFKL